MGDYAPRPSGTTMPSRVGLVVVIGLLAVVCRAQTLTSDVTLLNCDDAAANQPCIVGESFPIARVPGQHSGFAGPLDDPTPCAYAEDGSAIMISDWEGFSVRPSDDLTSITHREPYACALTDMVQRMVNGHYWFTVSSHVAALEESGTCFCQSESACHERVLFVDSSGPSGRTNQTYAPLSHQGSPGLVNQDTDVIDAPVVLVDCRSHPSEWKWTNATGTLEPGSIAFLPRTPDVDCPSEQLWEYWTWFTILGYRAVVQHNPTTTYATQASVWTAPSVPSFVLHSDDGASMYEELLQNYSITISFGPSFLSSTELPTGKFPQDWPPSPLMAKRSSRTRRSSRLHSSLMRCRAVGVTTFFGRTVSRHAWTRQP